MHVQDVAVEVKQEGGKIQEVRKVGSLESTCVWPVGGDDGADDENDDDDDDGCDVCVCVLGAGVREAQDLRRGGGGAAYQRRR
jgi:hypothetical protein